MTIVVKNTELDGVKRIITDRYEDYRGELGGIYDEKGYTEAGLTVRFVNDMVSFSYKNVLRGIHGDNETTKLVQCLHGTVYSVIVNCNEKADDFGKWQGFILSDKNHQQLYIPPLYGCSYYVLTDATLFHYKLSKSYSEHQFTYRWDEPKFDIQWPTQTPILGTRDAGARWHKEEFI